MNVVEVSQASTSLGQLNRELLSYIFVNFSTRDVARARVNPGSKAFMGADAPLQGGSTSSGVTARLLDPSVSLQGEGGVLSLLGLHR